MDLLHDNPMLQGVRQMLGAFAKNEIRPIAAAHDADETMPWDLMKKAQGFGMSQTALVDAAKGMPGASPSKPAADGAKKPRTAGRMTVVAAEELAWGCAGIALALGGSGLAAAPVAAMGNADQIAEFKDALSGLDEQGRIKVAAMALSEPSTGSDISSLSTTAREDGDHYVINGSKQWITNGKSAGVYVVWAQTNPDLGRAGVRGFIIRRGTEGLVPGRKEIKLGIRASETAQVHFEDCRVQKDLMLGVGERDGDGKDDAKGLADTKKMLDSTRPVVAAQAVGIARAAFDFLHSRIQSGEQLYGKPLAGHQHIAFALAEMEMEIQASRMLTHRAAWMADHRLENVRAASVCKAHAARTAQWVTTEAMAILGEEALVPGHPVEKWHRDAKIYDIFEGTGQIQRRIIARSLLGINAT